MYKNVSLPALIVPCPTIPPQVPDVHSVMSSFKKLMRACNPSSSKPGPSTFLSDVEQSGWLTSLTTLLQLASAVADLSSIQSSSVLVALEKGMDATAQVRQDRALHVCTYVCLSVFVCTCVILMSWISHVSFVQYVDENSLYIRI